MHWIKQNILIVIIIIDSISACYQNKNEKTFTTIDPKTENKIIRERHEKNKIEDSNSLEKEKLIRKDSNQKTTKNHFEFIDATSNTWVSGVRGGNTGTEYYFKIRITTKENIKFDSAWINNKIFNVYISKVKPIISSIPIQYLFGDTIILRVSDINHMKKEGKNVYTKYPVEFKGAALIRYFVNKKTEFYTIKEIKSLPTINRP